MTENLNDWFLKCMDTNLIINLTSCETCQYCEGIQDLTIPLGYGERMAVGKTVRCVSAERPLEMDAINVLDEEALSVL